VNTGLKTTEQTTKILHAWPSYFTTSRSSESVRFGINNFQTAIEDKQLIFWLGKREEEETRIGPTGDNVGHLNNALATKRGKVHFAANSKHMF
jgi:hypothetical protein